MKSSPESLAGAFTRSRSRRRPRHKAHRPKGSLIMSAENELRDHLAKLIDENEVILFMKGNPDAPACGFSARAVAVLNSLGRKYAAVDILPDPRIRQELTAISDWPTIPQLFVDGE